MTLGAYKGAHLLVSYLFHVYAHGFQCFRQNRACDQLHCGWVVTILAANRVGDFIFKVVEVGSVELADAHFVHKAGHICTLAGPAGGCIDGFLDPLGICDILDGIIMASSLEIVLAESIAGKEDYFVRIGVEIVSREGAAELCFCVGNPGL